MLPETSSFLGMGILGAGGLAAIIFGASYFLGKDGKGKKGISELSKAFQKKKQNEIKSIDKKQTQVAAEIKKNEVLSKDSQTKIRNIVDKAADDIDRIISTDMTIEDVHNEINDM